MFRREFLTALASLPLIRSLLVDSNTLPRVSTHSEVVETRIAEATWQHLHEHPDQRIAYFTAKLAHIGVVVVTNHHYLISFLIANQVKRYPSRSELLIVSVDHPDIQIMLAGHYRTKKIVIYDNMAVWKRWKHVTSTWASQTYIITPRRMHNACTATLV